MRRYRIVERGPIAATVRENRRGPINIKPPDQIAFRLKKKKGRKQKGRGNKTQKYYHFLATYAAGISRDREIVPIRAEFPRISSGRVAVGN